MSEFFLPIRIPEPPVRLRHQDAVVLLGSCFTEHISTRLARHGFRTATNPQGILFNPISTAQAVENTVENRLWQPEDLFPMHGLWNSWQHHSRFSHIHPEEALLDMNRATSEAHKGLQQARWLIITLGTAFQYVRKDSGIPVANNHRAPAPEFEKQLLSTAEIHEVWGQAMAKLQAFNPDLRVVFTVSPVRHARDGAIANNRSKGRLLDAVHTLCETFPERVFYFPAYELVVDVLRDYRFYDLDLIHPNHAATQYVWEQFRQHWIAPEAWPAMAAAAELATARAHRPRFPELEAHETFRQKMHEKVQKLQAENPWMELAELEQFFRPDAS